MPIERVNGPIRDPKDFWSGVMFVVVGVAAIVLARGLPMGSATRMGPAYFPTVLGGLLALIGVVAIIRSFVLHGTPVGHFAWKPIVLMLGSNVLFGVLLRPAGVVVALIVLVLVSAWGSVYFRWGPAIVLAIALTVFSVLIFVKALGLPIPIFGPWLGA
jgi:putative tricarboxylic transport membrane protein